MAWGVLGRSEEAVVSVVRLFQLFIWFSCSSASVVRREDPLPRVGDQPWRCLCRWLLQITMIRPWRRITLQLSQIFLTLGWPYTPLFS
jgi:hypothetical protein